MVGLFDFHFMGNQYFILTPQHRRVVASFPMITHSAAFQWLFEFKHLLCITVVSTENRIQQSF